ncbi:hypothetical protein SF23_05775 [Streptomyces sp. MBRL 10]|nr:hypothetical protein SF23_05775 [Streptomyces sp. MBRL 10]
MEPEPRIRTRKASPPPATAARVPAVGDSALAVTSCPGPTTCGSDADSPASTKRLTAVTDSAEA